MGAGPQTTPGRIGETFVEGACRRPRGLLASRPPLDVTGEDFTICHKVAHGGKPTPQGSACRFEVHGGEEVAWLLRVGTGVKRWEVPNERTTVQRTSRPSIPPASLFFVRGPSFPTTPTPYNNEAGGGGVAGKLVAIPQRILGSLKPHETSDPRPKPATRSQCGYTKPPNFCYACHCTGGLVEPNLPRREVVIGGRSSFKAEDLRSGTASDVISHIAPRRLAQRQGGVRTSGCMDSSFGSD